MTKPQIDAYGSARRETPLPDDASARPEWKVLVVEDEKRMADLLKTGLEEYGYEVTVAYDGAMGSRLAKNTAFNAVICDVVLPEKNGFSLCQEIKASDSPIPILMLTALGTIDDKLEGFDSGADDYMTKPFDFRELDARLKILMKRHEARQEDGQAELDYADLRIDLNEKRAFRSGREIRLTPKEFYLLEYMMRHSEKVLSRTEIARDVWNKNFDTGTNFIDVYINYLRKKIDHDFDIPLIHTRTGMGFILKKGGGS